MGVMGIVEMVGYGKRDGLRYTAVALKNTFDCLACIV